MKFLLLLLFLTVPTDTSVCVKTCTCTSLSDLFNDFCSLEDNGYPKNSVIFNESSACVVDFKITSTTHDPVIGCFWNKTEIPAPANAVYGIFAFFASLPNTTIDMMEDYGIQCEHGKWWITKYPYIIRYAIGDNVNVDKNASDLATDGQKTEIILIAWFREEGFSDAY